jgi:hypothetical protein
VKTPKSGEAQFIPLQFLQKGAVMQSFQRVLGMSAIVAISTAAHSARADEVATWFVQTGAGEIQVTAFDLIQGHQYKVRVQSYPDPNGFAPALDFYPTTGFNYYLGWSFSVAIPVVGICNSRSAGTVLLIDESVNPITAVDTNAGGVIRSWLGWAGAC